MDRGKCVLVVKSRQYAEMIVTPKETMRSAPTEFSEPVILHRVVSFPLDVSHAEAWTESSIC